MADDLGDVVAARRLEEAIWAVFEQAASKAGCPTADIEAYYKMVLEVCRPASVSRAWDPTQTAGPKPEADVLQAQYRIALEEIYRSLNPEHLESTFAALVRDRQSLPAA
jgi:hypothetical protein